MPTAQKTKDRSRQDSRNGVPRPGRRQAILVLGAHRSGTSALTRVLSLRGASLPATLMHATSINPLGFFESLRIFELHERILHELGSSWDDLAPISDSWIDSGLGQNFINQMADVVRDEFEESPLFVVKDPRICRLVPFWIAVLEALDVEPLFVLPVRNPLEMAESLRKAESVDQQKALLIWLNSVLTAERACRGSTRSIVEYADLLNDWRSVLEKLSSDLNLSFARTSRKASAEIDAFLSSELRHQVVSPEDLSVRSDVIDWIKLTFEWMRSSAAGKRVATGKIDALRTAFSEAERVFGPVLAQAELARDVSDSVVSELQARVVDLTETKERLAGELEPLGGEAESLRVRLESREQQVGELINCIKLMLVWIASRAPGNKSSSEELQVLLEALDTSDSESISEAAMEGLRHYQTVLDGPRSRRSPRDTGGRYPLAPLESTEPSGLGPDLESSSEFLDLKASHEKLEKKLWASEDQLRVVESQLGEKQEIVKQTLGELSGAEERLEDYSRNQVRLEKDLNFANDRGSKLAADLESSEVRMLTVSKELQSSQAQADVLRKKLQASDDSSAGLRERTEKSEGRAGELQKVLDGSQSKLLEVQGRFEQQAAEIASLKSVVLARDAELRQQAESLDAERGQGALNQSELEMLHIRASQLEEERLRIQRRLSESDRELRMVQLSRSWRVTLPLRYLGLLAKKMRLTPLIRPFVRMLGLGK
ncbi:MAG: hypothetical protein P8M78_04805 [Myxococcota bacterium]|nr:hypothetical protein [Myxococcota bacterium]